MSGNLVKAMIFSKRKSGSSDIIGEHSFYVQFNPNEIRVAEAVGGRHWESTVPMNKKEAGNGGISMSPMGLKKKEEEEGPDRNKVTLSTSLFYNTYDRIGAKSYKDVRDEIKKFYLFLNKKANIEKGIYQIGFLWGSIQVVGDLSNMSVRYTLFSQNGTPVRAEVDISITGEYYDNSDEVKLTKDQQEIILLKSQGSLSSALALYPDPANWRSLLGAMDRINPRMLL